MQLLEEIAPKKKHLVFDLVEQSGVDMSDWIHSSKDPRGYKANPRFCYEWAFVEPGSLVVLNLWHEALTTEDGEIVHRGNFRREAKDHEGPGGKVQWLHRALRIDEALKTALASNLPVRVIVNSGERRQPNSGSPKASKVLKRELDPKPWTIVEYDWTTGAHVIMRGLVDRKVADQFDLEQAEKALPGKRLHSGTVFVRDPRVRADVKRRSNGHCEFCGDAGFEMSSGSLYLETHHIIPLAEGGLDEAENVIALCPRDHRMAHYSRDAVTMRSEMTKIVSRLQE
jgi:5-methylcytosine-specific restriction protein A